MQKLPGTYYDPRCEPPVSLVFLTTPFELAFPFDGINPGFAGC